MLAIGSYKSEKRAAKCTYCSCSAIAFLIDDKAGIDVAPITDDFMDFGTKHGGHFLHQCL